jgi:hypothetical protein
LTFGTVLKKILIKIVVVSPRDALILLPPFLRYVALIAVDRLPY